MQLENVQDHRAPTIIARIQQGVDYLTSGDMERSVETAVSLLEDYPDVLEPYLLLFQILLGANQSAKALEVLELGNKAKPLLPPTAASYADLLIAFDRPALASEVLTRAFGEAPTFPVGLQLAKLKIGQQDFVGAARILVASLREVRGQDGPFDEVSKLLYATRSTVLIASEWEEQLRASEKDFLREIYARCSHMSINNGALESGEYFAQRLSDLYRQARYEAGLAKLPLRVYRQSDCVGLGGIAALAYHIMQKRLGWDEREIVMLANPADTPNPALCSYYLPFVTYIIDDQRRQMFERSVGDAIVDVSDFFYNQGEFLRTEYLANRLVMEWASRGYAPLLTLRQEDEERGWQELSRFGMQRSDWFVALHMRENSQLRANGTYSPRDVLDWRTYLPSIEEITRQGGWVIRLGDSTATPLPPMQRVVDLTTFNTPTDLLHVFSWARARFCICSTSGPSLVPLQFGTPSIMTNWIPLAYIFGGVRDLFIPKLLRHAGSRSILSLAEMVKRDLHGNQSMSRLQNESVELVENDLEELLDGTKEMIARTASPVAAPQVHESSLQSQFNGLLSSYNLRVASRISHTFLARHPELLS